MMCGPDTLIQADWRFERSLQFSMIDDVIVRKRLLDHHQMELVQLLEMLAIGEAVGRISVGH